MLRILEMARLYKDLCDIVNTIPSTNFTTMCDLATMKFSLAEKDITNSRPDVNTTATPSNRIATSHDGELVEDSNSHRSKDNTVNSEDQKGDTGDLDDVSSGGEDMEGYESDTSSSSSSSSGEDVVVEGYGDSGEEGEERLTEEEEEEEDVDEDEALVTANIQQLKVSSMFEQID